MTNYRLYDTGLCHPFPFANAQQAAAFNRVLGSRYVVRAFEVRVVSEDVQEWAAEERAVEVGMETDARKYGERWGE